MDLVNAITALHHGDVSSKAQADRWLEQWQQSPEAWSLSDAVLHNPSSNMESQHFCAQTLKTKVRRAVAIWPGLLVRCA
jgi:transportin-3